VFLEVSAEDFWKIPENYDRNYLYLEAMFSIGDTCSQVHFVCLVGGLFVRSFGYAISYLPFCLSLSLGGGLVRYAILYCRSVFLFRQILCCSLSCVSIYVHVHSVFLF